jgi:hypothetical protein
VYVRTDDGWKRVTIRGWTYWASYDAPDVPGGFTVKRLAEHIKDIEAQMAARLTERYYPESYTILSQQLRPPLRTEAPEWPVPGVDIAAIADSAPLAPPSPVDRLVGHAPVDGGVGRLIWDLVVAEADVAFPFDNRAAQFGMYGRAFGVGARQEVPGGSPFLPPYISEIWYRTDRARPGPPLLGKLLANAGVTD